MLLCNEKQKKTFISAPSTIIGMVKHYQRVVTGNLLVKTLPCGRRDRMALCINALQK